MLPLMIGLMFLMPSDPTVLTVYYPDAKSMWIDRLAECESGNRADIKVLDTNAKYSYGRFQFQAGTWLAYGKPFGATMDNIYDGELQGRVVRSMLDDGGERHWYNCSRALGPYPL